MIEKIIKKIFLTIILFIFLINVSFANEEKKVCKFFNFLGFIEDEKIFEKYKSCNENERIIDMYEKNGDYFYFVYGFNNDNGVSYLKLFFNENLIYKKDLKDLPIAIVSKGNIYVSKYGNHILSFIGNSDTVPKEKEEENKKIVGYYLDNKKILDISDDYYLFQEKIIEKLKDTNFKINYKKEELKIYNNFSNENFYLSKNQIKEIDDFLKNITEDKKNTGKINNILKKAEKLKEAYENNLEKTEILNYIISELKIFKLKNS